MNILNRDSLFLPLWKPINPREGKVTQLPGSCASISMERANKEKLLLVNDLSKSAWILLMQCLETKEVKDRRERKYFGLSRWIKKIYCIKQNETKSK